MDHSKDIRISADQFNAANLKGATVYGAEGHKVGEINHVHGSGIDATVVIDVGGFLGITAKPVAVPIMELDIMRDDDGYVHAVTSWTKNQLEVMPEHHD